MRNGPIPEPADALLQVARLRAEASRLGIREVNVARGPGAGFGGPSYVVRLSPMTLKVSQEVRLKRLVKNAVYKPDAQQLQLPVRSTPDLVEGLLTLLRDLVPPVAAANVETP